MEAERVAYASLPREMFHAQGFRCLTPQQRDIFWYLWGAPSGNMAGCYYMRLGYISADLGYTEEAAKAAIAGMPEFVRYDERTGLVLLVQYLRYNQPHNDKQVAGICSMVTRLDPSPLLAVWLECAIRESPRFADRWKAAVENTLSIPSPYPIDTHTTVSVTDTDTDTVSVEAENKDAFALGDTPPFLTAILTEFGEAPPLKGKQTPVTKDALALAKLIYDFRNGFDGLPAEKRSWFWAQARYAQDKLLPVRPVDQWVAAWEWGVADNFWREKLDHLAVLGDKVWMRYAAGKAGKARAAPVAGKTANDGTHQFWGKQADLDGEWEYPYGVAKRARPPVQPGG